VLIGAPPDSALEAAPGDALRGAVVVLSDVDIAIGVAHVAFSRLR
jgi:hypothetical protein